MTGKYTPLAKEPEALGTAHEDSLTGSSSTVHLQDDTENNAIPPGVPPEDPPAYERGNYEPFEIEEPLELPAAHSGFIDKAGELARSFNMRVITPLHQALDPVYEAWHFASNKMDSMISKVGNPLIIKRLLYVVFVAVVIYMISVTGSYRNQGTLYGTFHDLDVLAGFVDEKVDPHRLEENMEYLSSMPHMAGTAGDLSLARYIQQYMRKSKLDQINSQKFKAFTNYPTNESYVKLQEDSKDVYTCTLSELESKDISHLAFNPGSREGNAKGKLVYANYGSQDDYDRLSVKSGFVALVKYGGGIPAYKKIQYAKAFGAVAVLFISDPASGSAYTLDSIQRDPVAYADMSTGNILDPGSGSADQIPEYFDYNKLLSASSAYPELPSMPISWRDFIAIMGKVKGKGTRMSDWDVRIFDKAVEIWNPDSFEISLANRQMQRPFKEMWNVVGGIEGSEQDGLAVVIGSNRDAACYGASEASGTAVMLELVSVLSEMAGSLKWRPLRSIYFVSFSGSNYNQAGTSNFAIRRDGFFRNNAFAYIDLDEAVSGKRLHVSGNPILSHSVDDSVHKTMDPSQNVSLADLWQDGISYAVDPQAGYSPFVNNMAVPSLSLRFKGSGNSYPKGTCLDTFKQFQESKVDPGMAYHKTLTSLVARTLFDLVDKPIVPLDMKSLVSAMNADYKDLQQYAEFMMQQKGSGAKLEWGRLEQALLTMKQMGREQQAFLSTWADIVNSSSGVEPNLLAVNRWDWNLRLCALPKLLTCTEGIYNRPWYRNVLFGRQQELPDQSRKFHMDSYPGVRDALADGNWSGAQSELNRVIYVIEHLADMFQIN